MKSYLTLILLITVNSVLAQVSLKIVKETSNTIYYYPNDSQFTIVDNSGKNIEFGTGSVIEFEGDFILKIKTKENKKSDIITSDMGKLSLSYEKPVAFNKKKPINTSGLHRSITILRPSQKYENTYAGAVTFTNGLHILFDDEEITARLNGMEIPVSNEYIVQIPEGALQLKFDSNSGELNFKINPEIK